MRTPTLAFLPSCLLLVAGLARAQGVGSSGSLDGTVTDPSGAVVRQATVTAEERDRGTRAVANTDAQGRYQFNGLLPALYDVTVQAPGFESVIQKGVTVSVGETVSVDFHLNVARATEVVEVNSE